MSRVPIAVISILIACLPAMACADVGSGADGTQFFGQASGASSGSSEDGAVADPSPATVSAPDSAATGTWLQPQPKCQTGGADTCAVTATCLDGSTLLEQDHLSPSGVVDQSVTFCASNPPSAPPVPSGPSGPQIYQAFKAVVPPSSVLHFQPSDNRTLVHFKSNYYTDGAPFDAAVDLPVGPVTYHVDFKVRPTEFDWAFGDGATARTDVAGAPYPHLEVTHEYQKVGSVTASVTTVWGADYRLNGGPWKPVDGAVTKQGAGIEINVREATPVLTD